MQKQLSDQYKERTFTDPALSANHPSCSEWLIWAHHLIFPVCPLSNLTCPISKQQGWQPKQEACFWRGGPDLEGSLTFSVHMPRKRHILLPATPYFLSAFVPQLEDTFNAIFQLVSSHTQELPNCLEKRRLYKNIKPRIFTSFWKTDTVWMPHKHKVAPSSYLRAPACTHTNLHTYFACCFGNVPLFVWIFTSLPAFISVLNYYEKWWVVWGHTSNCLSQLSHSANTPSITVSLLVMSDTAQKQVNNH